MPHHTLDLPTVAHRSCYRINSSYQENADLGPNFDGDYPQRPKSKATHDFLGYKLRSPLGIPAGPLLNAKWVAFAAKMGFDVVAYKTMRPRAHASHPVPNVVFVEARQQEDCRFIGRQIAEPQQDLADLTITNSFGNPSRDPDFLRTDIRAARESLSEGQVLIVSAFGSGDSLDALAEDYTRAAVLAEESGAHVIEINLSCPNLSAGEGSLFTSEEAVTKIGGAVAKTCQLPVVLKTGVFPTATKMREILLAATRAGLRGLCGLNTIPMKIVDTLGGPALGPDRPVAGVCGGAIREHALNYVKTARNIIDEEKLGLALLGCGGITLEQHFDAFLDAGADIAMTATGMMWDPYLAMRWHNTHQTTES